ncbi:hypothetical protein [Natronoglycomyces albus]|uniref:Lipoprotein n=1 Tax=Natronoglycomyces albus TaxID=2811108 RepID=A0A895XKA1_9ACTN|nr:hypothetical protein [Natronoglycomyces albus]QSB05764.1 hypothetical protein JQS30_02200 [Natronoglycomyces albus]
MKLTRMTLMAAGAASALLLAACGTGDDAAPEDEATPTAEAPTEDDDSNEDAAPDDLTQGLPDELEVHDVYAHLIHMEDPIPDELVQTPESMMLQENSNADNMEWYIWGPDRAVAIGTVSGLWCMPECVDEPYEARITLCDVQDDVFTRFSVVGDFEVDDPTRQELDAPLYGLPDSGPYDPDNHFGCLELGEEGPISAEDSDTDAEDDTSTRT